jgi:hypothetical protein
MATWRHAVLPLTIGRPGVRPPKPFVRYILESTPIIILYFRTIDTAIDRAISLKINRPNVLKDPLGRSDHREGRFEGTYPILGNVFGFKDVVKVIKGQRNKCLALFSGPITF